MALPAGAWSLLRANAFAIGIVVLCAAAVVWQSREYLGFFEDDAFISLRYSWRLIHGHGLSWTEGEPVEGYSNLLWVLLIAAGGVFDADLVQVSRVLGLSLTVLAIVAIVHAYRPKSPHDVLPPLAGGLAVALTSPVVAWSVGGLEQPLLAALVAWATVLAYRLADGKADSKTATRVGVLLGLAAITRPDGALFTATTCGALVLGGRFDGRTVRTAGKVLGIAALFYLGQLAFRLAYYRAWIPNTAQVKLAFTTERFTAGWRYVTDAGPYLGSLALLALVATAIAATQPDGRRRALVPLLSLLGWTPCVVFIGGDYTHARRHLVPSIVLMSLLTAEGLRVLAGRRQVLTAEGADPASRFVHVNRIAAVIVAVFLAVLAHDQSTDPEKQKAIDDTWTWAGRPIGGFLSRAFATERPLVAVDAAGSLPYYAPELPFVDMLGLNDRFIATHHPPGFGAGFIGHELGNGDYLLRRKPDLIAFHTSEGEEHATWLGGREMQASPEFARRYKLVVFLTPDGTTTRLWVRKDDSRIGVERSGDEVRVPGFLFDTAPDGVAELDPEGRLGLRIDATHPARLVALDLDPGRWDVRVEASGEVDASASSVTVGDAPLDGRDVREPGRLLLGVALRRGERAHLRRVVFRKVVD
jgi:arabinofuranosyltransferase